MKAEDAVVARCTVTKLMEMLAIEGVMANAA